MNWKWSNYLENNLGRRYFMLLGMLFILYSGFGQCYRTTREPLTFQASEQNLDSRYTTIFVLTDYMGTILSITSDTTFGVQPKGLYKIYGVNYATSSGLDGLVIGSGIDSLAGECVDVSQPFSALVCSTHQEPCQTYDGKYSFQSVGGNQELSTVYVLTDLSQKILQISDTTAFSGIDVGQYLIFPLNYREINNLVVGESMANLSGICYEVGNPILLKSCVDCYVNAGSDITLCASQDIMITSMGSGPGRFQWSNGLTGNTIKIKPAESTHLIVTYTSEVGCEATDSLTITILSDLKADAGPDQMSILYYRL
jgi:hypothetical protein